MWHVFSGRRGPAFIGAVSLSFVLSGCSPTLLGSLFSSSSQSPSETSSDETDDGGGAPVVPAAFVTIARATGQASKTQVLPITFDITFSGSVTGFDASDVTFNGDPAEIAFNVTGSGANYQVVVTAVDRSRKLIPTVQASAAIDVDGVTNTAAVTANASQRVDHLPLKFKQIASASSSNCGLTSDGGVYCWGTGWGQGPLSMGSAAGTKFVQIEGGGSTFCALTAEGLAYCWGSDSAGQLGNGAALTADQSSPSPVDMGPVTGGKFVQITTGSWSHTCGLTPEGLAYCWGNDLYGQLGNGVGLVLDQESPSPVDMGPLAGEKFVHLTTGHLHTCGLTAAGLAYCWGREDEGQLGNGAGITANQYSPSPVDMTPVAGGRFVQLTAVGQTCGLTPAGLAYCWGLDSSGQLGNGAGITANQTSPSPVDMAPLGSETFTQIYGGVNSFACGLTAEGLAYCWGSDSMGKLGNGLVLTADQVSPSPVDMTPLAGEKLTQISSGNNHSCGLTASGSAYCWGFDSNGELGNGGTLTADQESPSPVMIVTLTSDFAFKQIVAGNVHNCALTAEGLVYCWGDDAEGQLGNGALLTTAQESPSPVDMSPLAGGRFVQLVAGGVYTCGLSADGLAYCWGDDGQGRLGNGAGLTADQASPSPVDMTPVAGGKFIQIVGAWHHSCGLTPEGLAYCWGSDASSKLGNGAGLTANQESPSPVDMTPVAGGRFVQIAAGGQDHTCGLTADGLAYCWGSENAGQLGNGAGLTADQESPSPVNMTPVAGGRFVQIIVSWSYTCGLTPEGLAYCWGWDGLGQLGNGAGLTANQSSPSPVDTSTLTAGDDAFVELSAGSYHACGLTAGGKAYCWGSDVSARLGNGAGLTANQPSPSPVDTSPLAAGDDAFVQISASDSYSCGLTAQGAAYCWGDDTYQQLGNGAALTAEQASPVLVDLSEL